MSLRDYQEEAVQNVLDTFKEHNRVMLQMPTGTGKTEVFCEIIKRFRNQKNQRVLVLVHRRELVEQIRKRLKEKFYIRCGIIMAGIEQNDNQIQIASIQTISRRDTETWPNPEQVCLIVIDEAHHATSKTYEIILNYYRRNFKIKILGVSATPCRLDKTGFKDVFDKLIVSYTINEFVEKNFLAGFKHLATTNYDLSKIKIDQTTQDYDVLQLGNFMSDTTIMSELVESYQKYAENKKCIIFAANVSHSKKIVERFTAEGFSAASIDANTKEDERKKIIESFESGKITILSNYQIFTEGFDCPDIGVVLLARPTKSFPLYLQMVGRAIRPKRDKSAALILDNASLWKTHGLITKDIKWSLDGAAKSIKTIACRNLLTGEVDEKDPKNIVEVEGLEMEEIFSIISKDSICTYPNNINKTILRLSQITIINSSNSIDLFPEIEEPLFNYLQRSICLFKELLRKTKNEIEIEIEGVAFTIDNKNILTILPSYDKKKKCFKNSFTGFYLNIVFNGVNDLSKINIVSNLEQNEKLKKCTSVYEVCKNLLNDFQKRKLEEAKNVEDAKKLCLKYGIGQKIEYYRKETRRLKAEIKLLSQKPKKEG